MNPTAGRWMRPPLFPFHRLLSESMTAKSRPWKPSRLGKNKSEPGLGQFLLIVNHLPTLVCANQVPYSSSFRIYSVVYPRSAQFNVCMDEPVSELFDSFQRSYLIQGKDKRGGPLWRKIP
jgi:hypothetical protein